MKNCDEIKVKIGLRELMNFRFCSPVLAIEPSSAPLTGVIHGSPFRALDEVGNRPIQGCTPCLRRPMLPHALKRRALNVTKECRYRLSSSPPEKVLFDHLPKCGGTTVTRYLTGHYPDRLIFHSCSLMPLESVERFGRQSENLRQSYSLITGHLVRHLIGLVDPGCLTVTLLRDPIERITSHYFYARSSPQHYLHEQIHSHQMTLEDYVSCDLSEELRNWYTTYFTGLSIDQTEANPASSVAAALEILSTSYDMVGTLESFRDFIESLKKRARLWHTYRGSIRNSTPNRPRTSQLPPATIEAIQTTNHLDIALYAAVRNRIAAEANCAAALPSDWAMHRAGVPPSLNPPSERRCDR
jgi:hypothetical protein